VISLLNLKYKDKACDRDSYDINKAAKDIADKTKKAAESKNPATPK